MKNITALLLIAIVCTACSRNSSSPNNQTVKAIITLRGSDSVLVKRYAYDGNNKLIQYRVKQFISPTMIIETVYNITRNSGGNIASFTMQAFNNGAATNLETSSVFYNNNNYSYVIKTRTASTVRDSVAFTYTNNNIVAAISFVAFNGINYSLMSTNNYTYNANGNCDTLTSVSTVNPNSRTLIVYQFDTNNNPLNVENEMLLLEGSGRVRNNITSINNFTIISGSGRPSTNLTSTSNFVYRLNSNGLPQTATEQNIVTSTSATTNNNIIYQY